MKTRESSAGFSLMEVNMAVFVMAIGILSMVALYPLGLRESRYSQADLKQSMFADYLLNQAVAAASQTNIPWSQWRNVPKIGGSTINLGSSVPSFIRSRLKMDGYPNMVEGVHYKIACCRVAAHSDKIMGIMVQSTELEDGVTQYEQVTNNPIYYAEVMFQGDPSL